MSFNESDFQTAHAIGLDALDQLDKSGVDEFSGLTALLTVTLHATFAMAPDEQTAEELITFARDMAAENWAEESAGTAARGEMT
jgi:hypothetical protein